MIKIKKIDFDKIKKFHKYNWFLYNSNQFIEPLKLKNFKILLNKIIEYQKEDKIFGSLCHLSTALNIDLTITYSEICDFIEIMELMFDLLEDIIYYGYKIYKNPINKDIIELSELTLNDYILMLKNNGNYNSYLRKKKLNKLNNI